MPKLISKALSEKKNSQNTTNKKPKRKAIIY